MHHQFRREHFISTKSWISSKRILEFKTFELERSKTVVTSFVYKNFEHLFWANFFDWRAIESCDRQIVQILDTEKSETSSSRNSSIDQSFSLKSRSDMTISNSNHRLKSIEFNQHSKLVKIESRRVFVTSSIKNLRHHFELIAWNVSSCKTIL